MRKNQIQFKNYRFKKKKKRPIRQISLKALTISVIFIFSIINFSTLSSISRNDPNIVSIKNSQNGTEKIISVNCTNNQEFTQNSEIWLNYNINDLEDTYFEQYINSTVFNFGYIESNNTSFKLRVDTHNAGIINVNLSVYSLKSKISPENLIYSHNINLIINPSGGPSSHRNISNILKISGSLLFIGTSGAFGLKYFKGKKNKKFFLKKGIRSNPVRLESEITSLFDPNLAFSNKEQGKITKLFKENSSFEKVNLNELKSDEFWDNF